MTTNRRQANVHGVGLVTALIYTRVSTDEQAREGLSLDAQLSDCRRYAAGLGWLLGSEYQDVLKGTRDDRPQYQALLAEARRLRAEGHEVAVVVAALDRFGRAILERVRSREELKRLGVPVHSVREGGEVSDIVANVLAAVAQEEVRRLGERVSAVRAHVAGNGWRFPCRCPWGYTWRPATEAERKQGAPQSVLDLDPLAAPFIREAFARLAAGESIRGVARWAAGLPSDVRGGRALPYTALRRLLQSAVYVARPDDHPEAYVFARPVGRWPALVDDDTYRRALARLVEHARTPRQASGRYLLTGLLRCPACGGRMRGHGTYRGCVRYRCESRDLGATADAPRCTGTANLTTLDADALAQVERLVEAVASTDPGLRMAIRRSWQALARPTEDTTQRARASEQAAARARERIKRLALLFADGDIDREGYELGRGQAQADLEAAEAELARLRNVRPVPALPPLDEVLRLAGGWRELLRSGGTSVQREVLAVLVETVTPERVRYGTYRARIAWTPTGALLARLANGAKAAAA